MPANTCPACNHRTCRAAVRLTHSWLELCDPCADRARRRDASAIIVREHAARAAFDAAIARGVTRPDAYALARQLETMIAEAAIRQAVAEGLVAAF